MVVVYDLKNQQSEKIQIMHAKFCQIDRLKKPIFLDISILQYLWNENKRKNPDGVEGFPFWETLTASPTTRILSNFVKKRKKKNLQQHSLCILQNPN